MGYLGDDEDELGLPRIAKPNANEKTPPLTLRGIGSAAATPSADGSTLRGAGDFSPTPRAGGSVSELEAEGLASHTARPVAAPSQIESKTMGDQKELSRLEDTGSGISQIKNPFARNTLRGLNVAGEIGSAFLPELRPVMNAIPGTEEHHNQLMRRQTARIGEDLGEQKEQAQTANLSAQPELKQAALDQKEQQINETQEKNQNQLGEKEKGLDEQYRKLGLKKDATGNYVPVGYGEMTPTEQAVHDLRESQREATDARAELDKSKTDPNSPMYQMQLKRLQVAEQNAHNASSRLQLSTAEFGNKLQEQNLLKPSGQAQSRASAATAVLQVMPDLEKSVRANAKEMGPIMGRLNRGEIAIGDVDPKVAQLYSAMKSFYALQPAVHGFRNAEFVKDFEHAIGTLERDPEAFLAGMHGLEPTMKAIANEGKTFHKRIVEGQPEQGGAQGGGAGGGKDLGPAPQGKQDGATGKLPDGTKVIVKGGRLVTQ